MDWIASGLVVMSGGIILMTIVAELVRCLGQSFLEKLTALFHAVLRLRMSGLLLPGPHGRILSYGEKFICVQLSIISFSLFFYVINLLNLPLNISYLIPEFDHYSYIRFFLECDLKKCNSWESGLHNSLNLSLSVICPLYKKGD